MTVSRLVDQQLELLTALEDDPAVHFGALARVEAVLAATAPDATSALRCEALRRIRSLRELYTRWESAETTMRRCAAALLSIDELPARFDAGDSEHWVPPFALVGTAAAELDAAVLAWRAWRDALLDGMTPAAARNAACGAGQGGVQESTLDRLIARWEAELVAITEAPAGQPDQTILLLDWVSAVTVDTDLCRTTLAAVVGRYGVLHLDEQPDDAVTVLPALAARLAARCALIGSPLTSLGAAVEHQDLLVLLRALRDPRVRALTLSRVDHAVQSATASSAGLPTRSR